MSFIRVYELRDEPNKYPGFIQVFKSGDADPEGWKEIISRRSMDWGGKRFEHDCTPIPLEFNNEGKARKIAVGDICLSMLPFIVFSEKARRALDTYLRPAGEFLEVAAPVPGFIGYRVLKNLDDCIDIRRSTYTQYENGNVMIRKATMYRAKVGGHDIFGVVNAVAGLFVSEAFKLAVEAAKLKGFDFSREVPLV